MACMYVPPIIEIGGLLKLTIFVTTLLSLVSLFAFADSDDLRVWEETNNYSGYSASPEGNKVKEESIWKMNCKKGRWGFWNCPSKESTLKGLAFNIAKTAAKMKCGGTDSSAKTGHLVDVTSGSFCLNESETENSKTVACNGYVFADCQR